MHPLPVATMHLDGSGPCRAVPHCNNWSVVARRMWQRTQRINLASKFPWSQSDQAFMWRTGTLEVPQIHYGASLDWTCLWHVKAWTQDLWKVSCGVWHRALAADHLRPVGCEVGYQHVPRCSVRLVCGRFGGQVDAPSSLSRSSGCSGAVFVVWHYLHVYLLILWLWVHHWITQRMITVLLNTGNNLIGEWKRRSVMLKCFSLTDRLSDFHCTHN